ncbi:hypothetical protein DFH06DRAFT_348571 [Mycena polygramma]|nr:hypothetical protein DFH06DRAFT_348571 [Mycena polygramma]
MCLQFGHRCPSTTARSARSGATGPGLTEGGKPGAGAYSTRIERAKGILDIARFGAGWDRLRTFPFSDTPHPSSFSTTASPWAFPSAQGASGYCARRQLRAFAALRELCRRGPRRPPLLDFARSRPMPASALSPPSSGLMDVVGNTARALLSRSVDFVDVLLNTSHLGTFARSRQRHVPRVSTLSSVPLDLVRARVRTLLSLIDYFADLLLETVVATLVVPRNDSFLALTLRHGC